MPGCQVCEAHAVDFCEDDEYGIHSGSAKSVSTEDAPAWTPAITKGGEEELLHFRMLQAIFEPESGLYTSKANLSQSL